MNERIAANWQNIQPTILIVVLVLLLPVRPLYSQSDTITGLVDGVENLMLAPVKVDLSSPPREILVTLEYKPAPKN